MIQENNLYEAMRRFFGELADYFVIAAEEQIELVCMPRGSKHPTYRECFPDLEQASVRVVSLGCALEVFVQVVVEPGTTPWNTASTQLLAGWCSRDRRPDDKLVGYDGNATCTELRTLARIEPSLAFVQTYPYGERTYEASWYYYRSRCPERARIEEQKRRRRQDEGD
jgi:hypothetical protein